MKPVRPRALVVLNGEPPPAPLLRRLAAGADLVVAADGGANTLHRFGVRVDVVIGDLDSIRPATKRHFAAARMIRMAEQNSTDFEKVLGYLVRNDVRDVCVTGVSGRRIDFTLGNFMSIWNFVPRLRLSLAGDGWFAFPVVKELRLSVPPGTTVSLIPFGSCSGVTLTGFRYPLRRANLRIGALGVSNVTKAARTSIRLRKGRLLAVISRRPKSGQVWE